MSHSRNDDKDQAAGLQQSHTQLSKMMLQGRSFSGLERNCVFLNTGTGSSENSHKRFATISAVSGLDFPDDGRAVASVDWDHDGDLDLWISNRNAPRLRLMRNDTIQKNHFLSVKLVGNGKTTNRDAIGARVELLVTDKGDRSSIQTLRAGQGFLSQSSKVIHFGLGKEEKIGKIMVHWPGGQQESFTGLAADRHYVLTQGSGKAATRERRPILTALAPATVKLPPMSDRARIPMVTLVPMPIVAYQDFDGQDHQLRTGLGRPLLVNLWASWCAPCYAELKEFADREKEIRTAGAEILALSVDNLGDFRSDPENVKQLLEKTGFPFPAGRATAQLINDFQSIHNLLIPLDYALPVPTSFLLDEAGRISVIYKGRVAVNDLLRDLKDTGVSQHDRLYRAAPIAGRVIRASNIENSAHEAQARILFFKGTSMFDNDRLEEAIHYYNEILRIKPDSFKTHYNLGMVYMSRRNLEPALYHLRRSVAINSNFADGYRTLGNLLLKKGDLNEAAIHFENVLRLAPDNDEALSNLGVVLAAQNQPNKAMEIFEKTIQINPNHVQAHYNLGALLLNQGHLDRATIEFHQVLQIAPRYTEANYNLGLIAARKGEILLAKEYYEREIRNNPLSAKAFNSLGTVQEQLGSLVLALASYGRALQLNPEFENAKQNMERTGKKLVEK